MDDEDEEDVMLENILFVCIVCKEHTSFPSSHDAAITLVSHVSSRGTGKI